MSMVFKESDKTSIDPTRVEYPSDVSGSLSTNSSWGMGSVNVFFFVSLGRTDDRNLVSEQFYTFFRCSDVGTLKHGRIFF
jgi:hypothetical protein